MMITQNNGIKAAKALFIITNFALAMVFQVLKELVHQFVNKNKNLRTIYVILL